MNCLFVHASSDHDEAAAKQAGSIEATVANADKADNFSFKVILEGEQLKLPEETVTGSKKWVRVNVVPGQYKLLVSAMAAGKAVGTPVVVVVKPGEIAKPEVLLPV